MDSMIAEPFSAHGKRVSRIRAGLIGFAGIRAGRVTLRT
jgi:hypothetical protein